MCGIAGAVVRATSPVDLAVLDRMVDSLAHRGPDGRGTAQLETRAGERVLLGHRRLAIIDPVGAVQPMRDDGAGLAITFNGEIYNFRQLREELVAHGHSFALDSDTEVLLRAYQQWGEECVHHLRGMFAFAVWDAPEQKLFLARDRFGEKPLYLHRSADGLSFASEIKALLQVPGAHPGVDLSAVWDFVAYRYVPGPRTLFEGIEKLPPGTSATWRDGVLTQHRYWVPPDREPRPRGASTGDAVAEFLTRLEEAVSLEMVSDVPFGAFLSGGLDSSTIVALMTRHNERVNTFSVGFGEGGYSELEYAGEVARHFGTNHHELIVDYDDIVTNLPRLIAYRDAPISEPSDIPIYLLAREASRTVKMVLTGEGADELLGGYPKHVFERFAGGYQRVPHGVRDRLLAPLVQALPYGFRRAKTAMVNLNLEEDAERYVRWFGALSPRERDQLLAVRPTPSGPGPGTPPFDSAPENSVLRSILYFDQTSWLPDNLLERGDRMSMAASIESRVPFLDHELAAYAATLADHQRVRGRTTKWVLRRAGRELIPQTILQRKKVGFRVPVNEWFAGPLKDYLIDHLRSADSITRSYYDPAVLDDVLDSHVRGRHNHEKLLWMLLNLEIWHRQYT